MIHFDLPKQKSSIIKVLGVGGGGSNAVNFMFAQDIEGVDFIICNTDAKAIEQSRVPNKIQLGPHLTQGLGAGANPEVGKKATEESLEEIKRILEVNTKMAFICAGMGGGTGTGGAPIISQICKDLGILTVGIVTTPFGFEGPRRLQQAEEGIRQLKPYVDTLLVISNDKLRMQYGNLKMKEAFSKADNVLATAAKCITDIINSRGHIIVDFADVCTVMKNGGVAILGKSEVEGEDRAQRAIEEALSSPLLNDSDIKGAKWILININSAEGEHECTMDEVETINNYLRMQAGEATDVIVGMGYDPTLDKKIGITLIATGFEHKDPFSKPVPVQKAAPVEEKIVMTLDVAGAEPKMPVAAKPANPQPEFDPFEPSLQDSDELLDMPIYKSELEVEAPVYMVEPIVSAALDTTEEHEVFHFELSLDLPETMEVKAPEMEITPEPVAKTELEELVNFTVSEQPAVVNTNRFAGLSKPNNIYAETPVTPPVETEEEPMQLVMREEVVAPAPQVAPVQASIPQEDAYLDESEEQKRRAAERIQKLRNLSFNMNTTDPNNEFDSVPAYIRRNMELFGNTLTSVENFYSKVTVGKDANNQTQLSTINTFLDGKKPD
ncbi:MAG: cell division protein FtsZ [Bacteroidetes bacterium 24-39-8]|jgi:cell division protein FtsZ|nr:MAG: cell division protein FtsZ [Sphingobacteriia bacterium 35-40-8]OYZ52260.1 MAG: cell division protein FtsZ [Bacteroidetes bacterium 24-39-8]OZA65510.1 MAG: cell division protein FtsZ [Sphingobacteriia bacterium 39-39-8]HQR92066.1 cell division protein FtsZ [Sediminibacterium sp.]HQS54669.1 cell division protein FtsZ [Sediminibacterium sp.]